MRDRGWGCFYGEGECVCVFFRRGRETFDYQLTTFGGVTVLFEDRNFVTFRRVYLDFYFFHFQFFNRISGDR